MHEANTSELGNATITKNDLIGIYNRKYGNKTDLGWGPKLRLKFHYFSPDEHYEALVKNIIKENSSWADIGCGRNLFPYNPDLARTLSKKAKYVLGIDPDETINDNSFVNEKFRGTANEYESSHKFDLITLRMVAEHVADPEIALQGIKNLSKRGSLVVIYTPNKWAAMSIFARCTSLNIHHLFEKILWDADKRDTFPVQFKMNTRETLKELFQSKGFDEVYFSYLDDCRTFSKIYILNYLELSVWRVTKKLGMKYPENCLLGIYKMR